MNYFTDPNEHELAMAMLRLEMQRETIPDPPACLHCGEHAWVREGRCSACGTTGAQTGNAR